MCDCKLVFVINVFTIAVPDQNILWEQNNFAQIFSMIARIIILHHSMNMPELHTDLI